MQKGESWSGHIERTYAEHSFWQKSNSTPRRYWDVRSSDGEMHSIRVHAYSTWSRGGAGDAVIKIEGQLDPSLIVRN